MNACKTVNSHQSSHHFIIVDVDAPPDNILTLYDLIANVTHESVAGTTRDKEHTIWKAHIRAAGGGGDNEKWFMIQDLIVEETRKEMIFLGETIIQVLSFLFNLPKKFNVTSTDLGTSDRSTVITMTRENMLSFTTFNYWSSRIIHREHYRSKKISCRYGDPRIT